MALPGSFGGGVVGKTTATLGTAWYGVVPPYWNGSSYRSYACLLSANVTNGNTTTNLSFMRPIGSTTTSAASSTGVNTITITADPGNNAGGLYNSAGTNNNIAANDVVVVGNVDGTITQYIVGAYNATSKVVTVTAANLTVNVASGAKVWDFGIFSDTDPTTGAAHPVIPNSVAANTAGAAFTTVGSGFRGSRSGDPLLIYCGNATNAVILNYGEYVYSNV